MNGGRRFKGRAGWWLAGVLALAGCDTGSTPATPQGPKFAGTSVTVGVIGDPALVASVQANRGEWAARAGAEIVLVDKPVEPKDLEGQNVDVVVFDGERLGDLIDIRALAPWAEAAFKPPASPSDAPAPADGTPDPAADPFNFNDILTPYRDIVIRYGEDRYALPLGGSAMVLVYRRRAFEDPKNVEAAKAAGLTLAPPKTWAELDALAKFFQGRDWDGDGKPESGIALAWGEDAEGAGDATFLARATSEGQHRDQYSLLFDSDHMGPRITSPPFAEALRAIVELRKSGPSGTPAPDIAAARKAFREGEVALLIDRAEKAAEWGSPEKASPIALAALPGSPKVFDPARNAWEDLTTPQRPAYLPNGGGWLVGVVSTGKNRDAAVDFAKYLASPETVNRLRAERGFPMLPIRNSQMQAVLDPRLGVESRPWEEAVSRTLNSERLVPGIRVPDARGYRSDLTKGRLDALKGTPAEAALKSVADAWSARTKALGQARQTWHYRRSLTKLSTAVEPPSK